MKSMRKKLLSAVAAISALAPVTKSFAASDKYGDSQISENSTQDLVEDTIPLMKNFFSSPFLKPVIEVKDNGDIFIRKHKIRIADPGPGLRKVGDEFSIDHKDFEDWLYEDRYTMLDAWYSANQRNLVMWGLKKFTNNKNAVLHRQVEALKRSGKFDECIRRYIKEILDSELEKAQEQIKKQNAKIHNSDENFEGNEVE